MKKILAITLVCLMLLPAARLTAAAEGEDYTLVIKGGQTSASMETVNGASLLRVDVSLNGVTDEKLLTALTFDLGFNASKVEYVTNSQELGRQYLHAVDSAGYDMGDRSLLINDTKSDSGKLRLAFATDYGCRIGEGEPLISLYFYLVPGMEKNTPIGFTVGSVIEAESVRRQDQDWNADYVQRTVGTSLTSYWTSEATTASGATLNGKVSFDPSSVQFKGTTPYVIYTGKAQTPAVIVTNKTTGETINPKFYTVSYSDNTAPGSATVTVTFRRGYSGTCKGWFKIYLPATKTTSVENVKSGIRISWAKVDGAAGYVIYRRAWNLVDAGWTTFERWNNTTATEWTDTTVYAGTRYQYGVKAYFAKRLNADGTSIGGAMDNYNLGEVGPLKTTVRITTRTLHSVTAGRKQMTVKWDASKVFTGYQIQYALDQNFTDGAELLRISDPKTAETTIGSLTRNKTYYVRVRSYHEFEGMTYYGEWSNVLSCKVK